MRAHPLAARGRRPRRRRQGRPRRLNPPSTRRSPHEPASPDAVEFIGFVAPRHTSEIHPAAGPAIDRDYLKLLAQAHEWGGFDRVLVAFHATTPDALLLAGQVAAVTERLGLMIAHRTGFTAPTVAARQFATLDQLTGGRVAIHVISGGDDRELAQDGDHLTKDARYARTREFLDIVRQSWTAAEPFDYAGDHYRVERGFSEVKPVNAIPVYFGGASPAALAVAGRHADTYALWGETHAQVAELIGRVRAAAAPHGRAPRFSLSVRPILAETEARAWERAEDILARTRAVRAARGSARPRRRRTRAPGGSSRPPPRGRATTSACSPPSRPRPGRRATRPPWSAPPSRSPTPCSTITTWACGPS